MKRHLLGWLLRLSVVAVLVVAGAAGAATAAAFAEPELDPLALAVALIALVAAIANLRLHQRRPSLRSPEAVTLAGAVIWISALVLGAFPDGDPVLEVPLAALIVAIAASLVYVLLLAPNAAWRPPAPPARVGLWRWLGSVVIVAAASGVIAIPDDAAPRPCSGELVATGSIDPPAGMSRGRIEVYFRGRDRACVELLTQFPASQVGLAIHTPGHVPSADQPVVGPRWAEVPDGCLYLRAVIRDSNNDGPTAVYPPGDLPLMRVNADGTGWGAERADSCSDSYTPRGGENAPEQQQHG